VIALTHEIILKSYNKNDIQLVGFEYTSFTVFDVRFVERAGVCP
jgi:hypothetical protein